MTSSPAPLAALAACLTAAPALAESFDCTLATLCNTESATCSAEAGTENPPFRLIIAEDGTSARMTSTAEGIDLTILDQTALGRSFLLRAGETGIGILTLAADGALAAVSNEHTSGGLIGTAAQGKCTAEAG